MSTATVFATSIGSGMTAQNMSGPAIRSATAVMGLQMPTASYVPHTPIRTSMTVASVSRTGRGQSVAHSMATVPQPVLAVEGRMRPTVTTVSKTLAGMGTENAAATTTGPGRTVRSSMDPATTSA
jgi:hypothetical protein